nr:hypothetical protein [Rhodovulum euryhalinum]
MITSRTLHYLGIPHFLIVETEEAGVYRTAAAGLGANVLALDPAYKSSYELCDNLGLSKSTGPGPARNFAWDHSVASGHEWHWVMDDNIRSFRRLHLSARIKVSDGAIFRAMEDFVQRYENVAMAGPNYSFFAISDHILPFTLNTRIYSCNLIRNNSPFRWRGRYNEDTILSLDMLKGGFCTILFNAFLQEKMATQVVTGGNTDDFYAVEGTLAKSAMLARVHPDVARVSRKFNRDHHHVDYRSFRRIPLVRSETEAVVEGNDDYGMRLVLSGSDQQIAPCEIPMKPFGRGSGSMQSDAPDCISAPSPMPGCGPFAAA